MTSTADAGGNKKIKEDCPCVSTYDFGLRGDLSTWIHIVLGKVSTQSFSTMDARHIRTETGQYGFMTWIAARLVLLRLPITLCNLIMII